jgi:hypothetical protein
MLHLQQKKETPNKQFNNGSEYSEDRIIGTEVALEVETKRIGGGLHSRPGADGEASSQEAEGKAIARSDPMHSNEKLRKRKRHLQ